MTDEMIQEFRSKLQPGMRFTIKERSNNSNELMLSEIIEIEIEVVKCYENHCSFLVRRPGVKGKIFRYRRSYRYPELMKLIEIK